MSRMLDTCLRRTRPRRRWS